jgi:hypothetical protein
MKVIEKEIVNQVWDEIFLMSDRDILLKKFEFREAQNDLSVFIYSTILDKQNAHQEVFSWRIILLMDQCFTTVNGEMAKISSGVIEKVLKSKEARTNADSDLDIEIEFVPWMNKIGQKELMNRIMIQHNRHCKSFSVSNKEQTNFLMTIVEIGLMYRNEVNRMDRILN